MAQDLLDIVGNISLKGKKIKGNKIYSNSKEFYACDCGCEQDGEGFCMDC